MRRFSLVIRWLDGYEVVYEVKPDTTIIYEINFMIFVNMETDRKTFVPLAHVRHWEEVEH